MRCSWPTTRTPCLRQQATGDCELETQARSGGSISPGSRPVPRSRRRRLVAIIKWTTPRASSATAASAACSDVKQNFRDRPRRQGHGDEHRLRHRLPMARPAAWAAAMHGELSHRAAHQQARGRLDLHEGEQITADDLLDLPMFAGASGTFLSLNRGSWFAGGSAGRRHLPGGRVRLDGVLHRERTRGSLDRQPAGPRQERRGAGERRSPGLPAPQRLVSSDEDPPRAGGHRFIPITRRWPSAQTIRSPSSDATSCSRDDLPVDVSAIGDGPGARDTEVFEI